MCWLLSRLLWFTQEQNINSANKSLHDYSFDSQTAKNCLLSYFTLIDRQFYMSIEGAKGLKESLERLTKISKFDFNKNK